MLERIDPEMYADKLRMAVGTTGIVENASNIRYEDAAHERSDDIVGFNRGNINVFVKGNGYRGDVLTAIYSDGKETFFDINNLSRQNIETVPSERYIAKSGFTQTDGTVSGPTLTQANPVVKSSVGNTRGVTPGVRKQSMQEDAAIFAPQAVDEESTSVNTDPAQHTPAEQAIIDEYQSEVDETLKETFESYYNNPKQGFSRHNISSVSERQASDASRLLGGEYKGYKNAINANGIKHILNEHGPNGAVDNSLSDMNDLSRMGYVLDNYDSVEVVTYKSGDIDTSGEFKGNDNKPAPMLKFSKKVNGTYYVVEAIPESKYKKFWVVSAYMKKADSGTQVPNANGPRTTPNASLASSLSVSFPTVTQANSDVNNRDGNTHGVTPGVKKQSMQENAAVFAPRAAPFVGSGLAQRMAEAETEYSAAIAQAEYTGEYELAATLCEEKLRVQDALTEQEIQRLKTDLERHRLRRQTYVSGTGRNVSQK